MSFGANDDDSAYKLYMHTKRGWIQPQKVITNSTTLQQRINETEAEVADGYADCSKTRVEEEDKAYTKNLLGGRL